MAQPANETTAQQIPPVPQDLRLLQAKSALLALPLDPPLDSKDPAHITPNLAAHLSHLRKQKFQYLELNAKDKYIKTIVSDSDDPPLVTANTNEALAAANAGKKLALQDAKARLSERQSGVRKLAPLVEQEHAKAVALTNRYSTLTSSIINARLALTRLRQTHPTPRVTISGALAHLDTQSASLQSLEENLSSAKRQVALAKERTREEKRTVEVLRANRAESIKAAKEQTEDASLVPIYDWYTNSLALHRCLHDMVSFECLSENELRLTYLISKTQSSSQLTLTLLFHPNTRLLASASCSPDLDIGSLVNWCVESNDVAGFVSSVLQLARTRVS